jgi:ATP-dependent DNA ligase
MAPSVARRRADAAPLPEWIRPQLTELVDGSPDGPDWLHGIKFYGYRMHARYPSAPQFASNHAFI